MAKSQYALLVLFFLALVGSAAAEAQSSPDQVQKILAFDVSKVPDAKTVLAELESRPEYASATARYQALSGMHSALRLTGAIPYSALSDPSIASAAEALEAQLRAKRDTYWAEMEILKQDIADDRDWQIDQRRYQVPAIQEFLPEVVELDPESFAILSRGALDEKIRLSSGARTGILPLGIYLVVGLFLLVLAWRRTAKGVADSGFSFNVLTELAEVMRERQHERTEVTGEMSGGGTMYVSGGVPIARPISGSISSTTTEFQEIFVKMKSGKEQVLNFVNFKVPCRETHRLSVLAVQRHGNAARGCGYHNHNTEETSLFKSDILAAIKPSSSGMAWSSWLLAFSFWILGAIWFSGEQFFASGVATEDAIASIVAIVLMALVPTFVIAFMAKRRSMGVSRRRLPAVIEELNRAIAVNEQSLQDD